MQPAETARLNAQVAVFTTARTLNNTFARIVYPFLGTFARGLGGPVEQVASVVAARSALGMTSPFLSGVAERYGRRTAMLLALAIFIVGLLTVATFPTLLGFTVGMLIGALGKIIFDPAVLAYIGDRVPYERRGQVLAITELSWSLSFIIGMPITGLLIREFDWRAPFPVLAGAVLIVGLELMRLVQPDGPTDQADIKPPLSGLGTVVQSRAALAGIVFGVVTGVANEVVNISYGIWLERSFGLVVTALGLTAGVIGVADLLGEGVVIGLVDRIGKRRLLIVGLLANSAAAIALPFWGNLGTIGALVGLFVFYGTFEIIIVGSIPLMTEIVPAARATMMGGYFASWSVGRALGALGGPFIFALETGGLPMLSNGIATAAGNLIGLALLLALIRRA
ncbi:MAG: MFS transporter [Anaerolineae bacterium]